MASTPSVTSAGSSTAGSRRGPGSTTTSVGSRPGDAPNERGQRAYVTGGTSKKPVNRTALEYDAPGTGKRVQKVPYALTKENVDILRTRFPGVVFRSSDDKNHDHPVAHTSTMIGTRQLQRMIFAGSQVLDLYGSPNANDGFNASQIRANNPKHVHTLVYEFSAKDALRRFTKWGVKTVGGVDRYTEMQLKDCSQQFLAAFDTYMSIHTLYYMSVNEVCQLLNLDGTPRRLLALVHRFDGERGELNNGEQKWVKDERGYIKQVNVASNESYTHLSTDHWFGDERVWQDHTRRQAFVWQLHLVCEGLWIVEATSCRYEYDASMAVPFGGHSGRGLEMPIATSRTIGPITVVVGVGQSVDLKITNPELFDRLCHWMVGKPRTSETLRDLFVFARRAVTPGELLPGVKGIDIDHRYVCDHVIAAYLYGVERELDLLGGIVYNAPYLREHVSLLKGTTLFDVSDLASVLTGVGSVAALGYRASRSVNPLGQFMSMIR